MTAKCFIWIELAIDQNEPYSSKSFLEFDFFRKCEKSDANSWECEIGRENPWGGQPFEIIQGQIAFKNTVQYVNKQTVVLLLHPVL